MDGISDRINERQKQRLFDFMAKYYQSLFGKFQKLDGKQHKGKLWKVIITDLNSMGPIKTLEQWQRCWRDLKKAAKSKLSQIRKYKRKSGGGVPCPLSLTDQESIIITICNLDSLDGVEGQELGINQTPPHTSSPSVRPSPAVSSSHDNSFHGFVPTSSTSRSRARPTTSHYSDSRRVHSLKGASPASTFYKSPQNSIASRRSTDRQSTTTSAQNQARRSSDDNSFHGFVPPSSTPTSRTRPNTTNLNIDSRRSASVHSSTGTSAASTFYESPRNSEHDTSRRARANSRASIASTHSTDRQSTTTSAQNQACRSTSLRGLQGQLWSRWATFRSAESTPYPSESLTKRAPQPARNDYDLNRSRSVLSSISGISRTSRNSRVSAQRNSPQRTTSESHDRHRSRSALSSISGVSRSTTKSMSSLNSRVSAQRNSAQRTTRESHDRHDRHRSRSSLSSISGVSRSSSRSMSSRNSSVNAQRNSAQRTTSESHDRYRSSSALSSNSSVSRSSSISIPSQNSHFSYQRSSAQCTARESHDRSGKYSLSSQNSHSSARHSSTTRSQEQTNESEFSFLRPTHTVQRSHQSRSVMSSISGRYSASVSNQNNTSRCRRTTSTSSSQKNRNCRSNSASSSVSRTCGRNSTSNRSRRSTFSRGTLQSDTEFSNHESESRRNLTGTLAQSVQRAAAVQLNIERNILSLRDTFRDGQEEIVIILRECLGELRQKN